jgi:hypothetical protein
MDDRDANALAALGHEPIETNVRAVWCTGAALAGVVIATFVLIIGLMKWFAASQGAPAANYAASNDSSADEKPSLQQLRVEERQMLDKYEWVDEASGTARIPLSRAIEIVSENGLPAALQSPAAPHGASTHGSSTRGNPPASAEGDEP